MPRKLVLGNGRMLLNFDAGLNIRDFYYPYVGQWNHIGGHKNSFGFWLESQFAWCDDPDWEYTTGYEKNCLVTRITGWHKKMEIGVEITDAVHYRDCFYLKRITVRNPYNYRRVAMLFFTHDFCIQESDIGDTAVYDPFLEAVYHYKRNFYFLANGRAQNRGLFQFTTGVKRFGGAEGTWRDAEDGILEGNPVAQGSVDSTIGLRLELPPNGEVTAYYWLVCGRNYQEARQLNQYVLDETPATLLRRIRAYWRNWLRASRLPQSNLPAGVLDLYRTSLLVTRTHIDHRGAIIAAADSDIMQFNRDHYAYAWPRDAAFVALAMINAGYPESTVPFLQFYADAITEDGYLLHKYNPDGTAGSSWHPWYVEGQMQLPVQEDETALVLIALWQHYRRERNLEFLLSLYRPLVEPAAEFIARYIDEEHDLPQASYDLWEEKRGIWTFTASAVYAALMAAARIAHLVADDGQAARYRNTAARIKQGILRYLYDPKAGHFIKGLLRQPDGSLVPDLTPESSVMGVFLFGLLLPHDPKMIGTVKHIENNLLNQHAGGLARYLGDRYFLAPSNEGLPGNSWVICTLWLAQWYIATARTLPELDKPLELLQWAAKVAGPTGILPEQINPTTGEHLSVSPLTWSHATLVETVGNYAKKYHQLNERLRCEIEPAAGPGLPGVG